MTKIVILNWSQDISAFLDLHCLYIFIHLQESQLFKKHCLWEILLKYLSFIIQLGIWE